MQDAQLVLKEYVPNYWGNGDDPLVEYEDGPSWLEELFNPHQVLHHYSPFKESLFHDSSLYNQEELYHAKSSYDAEEISYNWKNWHGMAVDDDESLFNFSACCGNIFFNDEDNYEEHGVRFGEIMEGWYEGIEREVSSFDGSWPGLDSWFGYVKEEEEEDPIFYSTQERKSAYGHTFDEMGTWEGIFGYWPCLNKNNIGRLRE